MLTGFEFLDPKLRSELKKLKWFHMRSKILLMTIIRRLSRDNADDGSVSSGSTVEDHTMVEEQPNPGQTKELGTIEKTLIIDSDIGVQSTVEIPYSSSTGGLLSSILHHELTKSHTSSKRSFMEDEDTPTPQIKKHASDAPCVTPPADCVDPPVQNTSPPTSPSLPSLPSLPSSPSLPLQLSTISSINSTIFDQTVQIPIVQVSV